jgi:hypothetical protein
MEVLDRTKSSAVASGPIWYGGPILATVSGQRMKSLWLVNASGVPSVPKVYTASGSGGALFIRSITSSSVQPSEGDGCCLRHKSLFPMKIF